MCLLSRYRLFGDVHWSFDYLCSVQFNDFVRVRLSRWCWNTNIEYYKNANCDACFKIFLFPGSPPSPVPPLPERTPESFEIADDQGGSLIKWILFKKIRTSRKAMRLIFLVHALVSVKQKLEVTPAGNLGRIGMSSEWCGDSTPAVTPFHDETSRWTRSKVGITKADVWFCVVLKISLNEELSLHN